MNEAHFDCCPVCNSGYWTLQSSYIDGCEYSTTSHCECQDCGARWTVTVDIIERNGNPVETDEGDMT